MYKVKFFRKFKLTNTLFLFTLAEYLTVYALNKRKTE